MMLKNVYNHTISYYLYQIGVMLYWALYTLYIGNLMLI